MKHLIAVLLSGFLVVGALVGIASASAEPEGSTTPPAMAQELENPDLDQLRPEIHRIAGMASQTWPQDYGWIWPAVGGFTEGIVIGFSRDAEEHVVELAKVFPWPELLIPETVKYSEPELQDIQNELIEARKDALKGEGPVSDCSNGRFDLGGDIPAGKVIVYMPQISEEVMQDFRGSFGADIKFVERRLAEFSACTDREHCGKALRAGIQARKVVTVGQKKCSTGFTVTIEGVTHILSAAHCSDPSWPLSTENRFHGANAPMKFGSVQDRVLFGGVDAEAISVESPFSAYPWIYRDDVEQQWPVKYVVNSSQTVEDDPVCRAGNTTGRRCGQIEDKMFSMQRQGVTLVQLIQTSACSGGGDSGGPVFYGYGAYGIHAGFVRPNNNPGCGPSTNQTKSIYSPINWVLNQLNAELVYAP